MRSVSLREKPIVSGSLVLINVVVFLICTFTGDLLYNIGRCDVWHVLGCKEYGRVFFSLFLHADVPHIFNNMLILFFLGAMIEKEIGHLSYLIAYLVSGLGGNVLSLFSKASKGVLTGSVGASGAIFGLDGVLLSMVLFWNKPLENVTAGRVLFMIAYSLYSGFTGQNVDNAAHIGGLVTGFVTGVILCLIKRKRTGGTAFEY